MRLAGWQSRTMLQRYGASAAPMSAPARPTVASAPAIASEHQELRGGRRGDANRSILPASACTRSAPTSAKPAGMSATSPVPPASLARPSAARSARRAKCALRAASAPAPPLGREPERDRGVRIDVALELRQERRPRGRRRLARIALGVQRPGDNAGAQ